MACIFSLSANANDQSVAATDLPCEKPPTSTRLHLFFASLEVSIRRSCLAVNPLCVDDPHHIEASASDFSIRC
jgi:hypothetical protein